MKKLFYESSKSDLEQKTEFINNASIGNTNQELKALFIKPEERIREENDIDNSNQPLKSLFVKLEGKINEEKYIASLNKALRSLFIESKEKISEEKNINNLSQEINTAPKFKKNINKFEKNDDLEANNQIKNDESSNIDLNSNVLENKNQLLYLYSNIINIDCIRIIDNSLYIYNDKFGYLKRINRNDEEIEINRLIPKEYRAQIHPNIVISIIRKLKSDPELQISNEEINKYKEFINCKNGVVDVRSGVLMPHDKRYKFTYVINANYNIEYLNNQLKLHNFNGFIETSLEGNKEKNNYLWRLLVIWFRDIQMRRRLSLWRENLILVKVYCLD